MLADLMKDLRLSLRQMASRPAMTALAVVSLALGIGVNSSIFSVVNAILLRGVPAERPEEVVEVYQADDFLAYGPTSVPNYLDLAGQTDVFAQLGVHKAFLVSHDTGEEAELLMGEVVSASYFELLGTKPALGRLFLPEEDTTPGTHPVVVLGHRFWQTRHGGDPGVLGQTLKLNGRELTIVGVASATLKGTTPGVVADYWLPLQMHDALAEMSSLERRSGGSFFVTGRLRPGVSATAAQAQVDVLAARLEEAYPEDNEDLVFHVVSALEVAINPAFDGALFGVAGFLLVLVSLVLLIACSNIANVLLARALDRQKEIALRLALGATHGRLLRQLLTESLVLAALAGGLGLVFAAWTSQLLVSFQPPIGIRLAFDLGLDAKVLAFTAGLALLTGVVCGLAPAWKVSRLDLVPALKDDSDALGGRYRKLGLRNVLVVGQVAVSTVLLIGSGLFVRSLANVEAMDPGFTLRQGAAVQLALGLGGRYDEERGRVFFDQLLERARALPGVRSAAYADGLPLGAQIRIQRLYLEGQEIPEGEKAPNVDSMHVGPGYFETMGIPILRGQDVLASDHRDAPGVAVVNETAARRFWPGEEALGQRLHLDDGGGTLQVVGVVADGKYRTLGEEPRPYVYQSHLQHYSSMMTLVVASEGDEAAILGLVREELRALDPQVPIFDVKTMSEHLSIMLFLPRMAASLLAAFGVLGLVLASAGLYGVVAYAVSRRTREVGIRMAIGAGRGQILRLVVGEGMALVTVGVVLGGALALAGGQALRSLLYGISPSDPATFVAVPLVLGAVALLANLIPARRATRIEPTVALRYE